MYETQCKQNLEMQTSYSYSKNVWEFLEDGCMQRWE